MMPTPTAATTPPITAPTPSATALSPWACRLTTENPITAPQMPATRIAANAATRAPTDGSADNGASWISSGRSSSSGTTLQSYCAPVRTLVVLPTYNEAENIVEVLRRVRSGALSVDGLVVDDSSPDGTPGIPRAGGDDPAPTQGLVRPPKAGLGQAHRAG